MSYSLDDWKKQKEQEKQIKAAEHRLGHTHEKHLQWFLEVGQETSHSASTFPWEFFYFLGFDGTSYIPEKSIMNQWRQEIRQLVQDFQKGYAKQISFGPLSFEFRFRRNGQLMLEQRNQDLNVLFWDKFISLLKHLGPRIWQCPIPSCGKLFVRSRRQKYCSESCGTRGRVRHHRTRKIRSLIQ
jgi:hypothetical protein